MNTTTKILLGAGFVTAVVGGSFVYNAVQVSKKAEFIPSIRIHSLDERGLTIALQILVQNPVNASMGIYTPFITLYVEGADNKYFLVATSSPSKEWILIEPRATTDLGEVFVNVPIVNLLEIADIIIAKGKLNIKAVAKITVTDKIISWIATTTKVEKKISATLPAGLKTLLKIA